MNSSFSYIYFPNILFMFKIIISVFVLYTIFFQNTPYGNEIAEFVLYEYISKFNYNKNVGYYWQFLYRAGIEYSQYIRTEV